jgi:hypothetical protein
VAIRFCNALVDVLSAVEELTLDLNVDGMPSDWENTLDNMLWHELLLPFIRVKKLHIGSSLTVELSQALKSDAGLLVLQLLPELQEIGVQLGIVDAKKAFSSFLETRESVGRPVHLSASGSTIPHTEQEVLFTDPEEPRADPEVHHIDPTAFLKYNDYVDGPYINRAIELIYSCRTFIQTQKHTFHSYDKLRR